MNNNILTGKVAVISGASRGIGEAIAHAFVKAGAKVVIGSRKEEEIKAWLDFIAERNAYWTQKQIGFALKSVTGPAEMRP